SRREVDLRGVPPRACARGERLRRPLTGDRSGRGVAARGRFGQDAALPRRALRDGRHVSQFREGKVALQGVNHALREAIVADQRAFEAYARRYAKHVAGRRLPSRYAGYYQTELDRTLVSASSVVVSVLIPRS